MFHYCSSKRLLTQLSLPLHVMTLILRRNSFEENGRDFSVLSYKSEILKATFCGRPIYISGQIVSGCPSNWKSVKYTHAALLFCISTYRYLNSSQKLKLMMCDHTPILQQLVRVVCTHTWVRFSFIIFHSILLSHHHRFQGQQFNIFKF